MSTVWYLTEAVIRRCKSSLGLVLKATGTGTVPHESWTEAIKVVIINTTSGAVDGLALWLL